jgi:hypothetical protein
MTIIHRRVFYARIGKSGPLVTLMKEADGLMQKAGFSFKSRYLTDFLSGRSDRVIMEWEVEGPSEIAELYQSLGSPEVQAAFKDWEVQMNELVEYSEVENLAIA